MENLHYYYAIVEEALLKSHVNPVKARGKKLGQWAMQRGSASLWMDIWHDEKDGRAYFQAMSPIIPIPEGAQDQQALYKNLLDYNNSMFGTYFMAYKGKVWVKVNRECKGLDAQEAYQIIQTLGKYADHYDDILEEAYT